MGENLRPAEPMNAKGFFTDNDFEALNISPSFADYCERRSLEGDWGLKSPLAIYRFEDFARDCGSSLKLIFTSRPYADSITSWKKLATPRLQARADEVFGELWQRLAVIEGFGFESISVDYPKLVNDPGGGVRRIADFCGRSHVEPAIQFVDPSLFNIGR